MKRIDLLAVLLTLLTIPVGIAAVLAADRGASLWIHIPLLTWLSTIGLPTTIGVVCTASLWGKVSPFYGLGGFAVTAMSLGCLFQMVVMRFLGYSRRRLP